MTKIKLINFHFAFNYGAVLQSYALKTVIESMDMQVEIIDYRPYGQMQYYKLIPNPFKTFFLAFRFKRNRSLIKRILFSFRWSLKTCLSFFSLPKRMKYKKAFEPFVKKNIKTTKPYYDNASLKKDPPQGEFYVCGSDQIWNPLVTFGYDDAYFLNFGPESTKRIAYAISPNSGIDEKDCDYCDLKKWLRRFDFISLRESEKKELIESITGKQVPITLDPTLLLNNQNYSKIEEMVSCPKDYILVYAFSDTNHSLCDYVEMISNKKNINVIDISIDNLHFGKNVKKIIPTPGQFLYLIKNASIVITNSFHATVFSIIYSKQFVCFRKTGTSRRMVELLEATGLLNRLYRESFDYLSCDNKISYEEVYDKLDALKVKSIDYLVESLGLNK